MLCTIFTFVCCLFYNPKACCAEPKNKPTGSRQSFDRSKPHSQRTLRTPPDSAFGGISGGRSSPSANAHRSISCTMQLNANHFGLLLETAVASPRWDGALATLYSSSCHGLLFCAIFHRSSIISVRLLPATVDVCITNGSAADKMCYTHLLNRGHIQPTRSRRNLRNVLESFGSLDQELSGCLLPKEVAYLSMQRRYTLTLFVLRSTTFRKLFCRIPVQHSSTGSCPQHTGRRALYVPCLFLLRLDNCPKAAGAAEGQTGPQV